MIPEISPPSPTMPLNPPPRALAIPPDPVFRNKFVKAFEDCEVGVLELDGEPNRMPVAVFFTFVESVVSRSDLEPTGDSAFAWACCTKLTDPNNPLKLGPPTFGDDNGLRKLGKWLL